MSWLLGKQHWSLMITNWRNPFLFQMTGVSLSPHLMNFNVPAGKEKSFGGFFFARRVCFIKLQFLDNNLDRSGTMR
jgi:hypothetical protein